MSYEKVAVGDFPEMWDFTEKETLEGYYIDKNEDVGPNHSNVYQVETDDGQKVQFWGTTVLDSQFDSVRVGERVKVVYTGLVDSPKRKGKQYKNFEVYHDPELIKEF